MHASLYWGQLMETSKSSPFCSFYLYILARHGKCLAGRILCKYSKVQHYILYYSNYVLCAMQTDHKLSKRHRMSDGSLVTGHPRHTMLRLDNQLNSCYGVHQQLVNYTQQYSTDQLLRTKQSISCFLSLIRCRTRSMYMQIIDTAKHCILLCHRYIAQIVDCADK